MFHVPDTVMHHGSLPASKTSAPRSHRLPRAATDPTPQPGRKSSVGMTSGGFTSGKHHSFREEILHQLVVHPTIYREVYGNVRSYMISGWWLNNPSEKYEFVSWDDDSSQYMENKKRFQTTKQKRF